MQCLCKQGRRQMAMQGDQIELRIDGECIRMAGVWIRIIAMIGLVIGRIKESRTR